MNDQQGIREYDDAWIAEQLEPMVQKQWGTQEIAGWFARAGYENGKAAMIAEVERLRAALEMRERALQQSIDCAYLTLGKDGDIFMRAWENDEPYDHWASAGFDNPELVAYLRGKESAFVDKSE